MATYTSTRLRVTRHSPVVSDRSTSHIVSGPSRLPEFSQLVDVNLNDMPTSETTEQQSASRPSTPSTVTRSEKPAAVLRALLSRLPPSSPPRAQQRSPSPQDPSERESDYDMSEISHATPSIAQESLRDLFSKARRDHGNTPQKSRPRRNSLDNSEVEASPANDRTRTDRKGKRRSLSDDEVDQANYSAPKRPANRSRAIPQPVTMEFLRERFDNSQSPSARPRSSSSNHDSSNETATILLNLSSSPPSPPMATSTPQQSLRISVNEQFQSNLLDENTEMQHAIEGLESYGESPLGRSVSPPHIMRKRSKLSIDKDFNSVEIARHQSRRSPSQPSLKSARSTPKHYGTSGTVDLREQDHDWDTPHPQSRTSGHVSSRLEKSSSQSSIRVSRDEDRSSSSQRSHSLLQPPHSNSSGRPPLSNSSQSRHQSMVHPRSASPSASSVTSHDDDASEVLHERERNLNSPHPVWHDPSPSFSPLSQLAESSRQRTNSFPASPHSREESHGLSKKRSTPSMQSTDSDRSKHRRFRRSVSPRPPEPPSPTPSRSSSLQPSDNTHRHNDPSLLHPGRSPSPLLSISKKRSASPSPSTTPRKQKNFTVFSSARKHTDPSLLSDEKENVSRHLPSSSREKSNGSSMELTSIYRHESSSKSLSHLSLNHAREEGQASLNMNDHDHDTETDDMKETDFSSQGNHTPPLSPVSPRSELPDEGRENLSQPRLSPRHDSRRSPVSSSTPHISTEDTSPMLNTFTEVTESPSTPPPRNTPRGSRIEFKTPSSPKDLPELPSPSSGDESERNLVETPAASLQSRANGHQTLQGIPTPRPPGGWYATPKPSRDVQLETSDDLTKPVHDSWDDSGNGQHYPTTPTNRFETPGTVGKTPKPPGGWVPTPGPPSSSRLPEREMPEHSGGLLTPVASLSKASFNPKTPGIPGGWLATPAPKKSILKVRFDSETTREESQVDAEGDVNAFLVNGHSVSQSTIRSHPEGSSSALPSSPRSPSKPKGPSIRVLDAFGREKGSSEMKDDRRSRSMLRVVDAMGREVEDTHAKSTDGVQLEELGSGRPSRGELLSHIRRGLDDLAGELGDIESDDEDPATKARIEELNAVSREARKARERMQRQNLLSEGMKLMRLHSSGEYSLRDRWRFYVMMALAQLLLLAFVYRLAMRHAKMHLLNSYYDPFNPDVHLYLFNPDSPDHFTNSDFSRSWYHLIIRFLGGKLWHSFLHFTKDISSYFWTLWDADSVSRNSVWLPT